MPVKFSISVLDQFRGCPLCVREIGLISKKQYSKFDGFVCRCGSVLPYIPPIIPIGELVRVWCVPSDLWGIKLQQLWIAAVAIRMLPWKVLILKMKVVKGVAAIVALQYL